MSSDIISSLRTELREGKVLLPQDDGYDDSLKRWSQTCVKPAAAVVLPKTTDEVATTVKFAAKQGIAFNVKGGGHSTSQSSSAPSPEGIVIDLELMRNVSVNPELGRVTFDGGCKWRDVDEALWSHGLATPGGTVSHTGVGGLILHGGFGILTGLHGLTIDCLISCKVVLADGRVVTASEEENPDLFWALRGAGSSFGVVTEFVSKAFAQGDIYGGICMFTPDKLEEILEVFNWWAENCDGSQGMGLGCYRAPPTPDGSRPPVIMVQAVHVGKNAPVDGPEYFAKLLAIEGALMKNMGVMPYPKFNQLADDAFFPWGKRYLFGGANFTTPLKEPLVRTVTDKFWAFTEKHAAAGMESSFLAFEGIPNNKIREVAVDSMAFNSRGNYFNIGISWSWEDPAVDAEVREFNRAFQKEVRGYSYDDEQSRDGVGRYLNYEMTSMTAESAFGGHAKKLVELKQKYDPKNVFDKVWKLVPQVEEQWAA